MDNNFNMTFDKSQDYIAKRGFDIPWNDCDVFVDEREITRTVGNVLKWADKTMVEKAIQWLFENVYDYLNPEDQERVESFRKYLEE
jgi:hypothetical protein